MPSIVDTLATRAPRPKADPPQSVTPEQIAEVLAYLVSNSRSLVNGAAIPVFGGM